MPTNVTGTLVDKNGQVWALATVQFIFQPAVDSKDKYTLAGSPFDPGVPTTNANGGGVFNITVPASSEIKPENSQWMIVITPNATSQAMVYKISTIPGTLDLTSLFAAVAELKLIQSVPLPRAYNDAEMAIPPNPGQLYYDTTSKQVKFFENNIWNPLAGGGTGGMIYPPAGIPVSTGSSWAASINPALLVTYPTPGLAVSNATSTGWDLSIDPATLQRVINLTTNGNSGPATLVGTTLNIPQYAGAAGGMVYPAAGVAVSDGAQWLASIPYSANTDPAWTVKGQGLNLVWNVYAGSGEQSFINSRPSAGVVGGFVWYNALVGTVLNSSTIPDMKLDPNSSLHIKGALRIGTDTIGIGNISTNGALFVDRLDGYARLGFEYTGSANSGVAGAEVNRLLLTVNGAPGVAYPGQFSINTVTSTDVNGNNDAIRIRHQSAGPGGNTGVLWTLNGVGDMAAGGIIYGGNYISAGVAQPITPANARQYGAYLYNDATALNVTVLLASADGNGRGAIYLGGIGPPNLPTKNYAYFGDGGSSITDNLKVANAVYIGGTGATAPRYSGDGNNLLLDPTPSGAVYFNWFSGSGGVNFGRGDGTGATIATLNAGGNFSVNGALSANGNVIAGGALFAGGLAGPYLTWDGGSSFLEGKPNGRLLINQISGPGSYLGVTGALVLTGNQSISGNLNTGTLQVASAAPNGYILMGNGSYYVPVPFPGTTNAVPSGQLNAQRAFNVVYQNTSGSAMMVTGWGHTSGGGIGSVESVIGASNPPTLTVGGTSGTATIQNGAVPFTFIVPNNWFYTVKANTLTNTQGSAVNSTGCWVETVLN